MRNLFITIFFAIFTTALTLWGQSVFVLGSSKWFIPAWIALLLGTGMIGYFVAGYFGEKDRAETYREKYMDMRKTYLRDVRGLDVVTSLAGVKRASEKKVEH